MAGHQSKTYAARPPLKLWNEKRKPVTVRVVVRWRKGCKPRNVLVEDICGFRWVRPFRGMRKVS